MSEDDHSLAGAHEDNISDGAFLIPEEGDLRRFFEALRRTGTLTVKDGSEEFLVRILRLQITDEARAFLTRGGPISGSGSK
jgi:hypothetical protein